MNPHLRIIGINIKKKVIFSHVSKSTAVTRIAHKFLFFSLVNWKPVQRYLKYEK